MAVPSGKEAQFLPKAEAAVFLNVSTRQIERYAEAGRLRTQLMRLPGDRTDRNIYALDDLQRVKEERETVKAELAPWPKMPESPAIAALTAILQQTAAPRIERAWLTLDEAAEHSGLTKAWLLKEAEYYDDAESGRVGPCMRLVRTRDMGKHARGGRWRFYRGDLDRASMEPERSRA